MEEGSNFVIVIGREFGSGGRTIGKLLASRLGIDYYDTELLQKAAESQGLNPEIFKDHDEKKPSVLKVLLQGAYGIADNFHTVPFSGVSMHNSQCKVIKDICKKGSCVIVGRSADRILCNHPRMLSIFLHSPLETRAQRIVKRGEASTIEEACEIARQHDRRRESYYNFYSGDKKWGAASNYHLSLDTSKFDNDTILEIILSLIKSNFSPL